MAFKTPLAGIAAPFTCDTVGLGYAPLKSPDAVPLAPAICVQLFEVPHKYRFRPAEALVLKYTCPTEHVAGFTAPCA